MPRLYGHRTPSSSHVTEMPRGKKGRKKNGELGIGSHQREIFESNRHGPWDSDEENKILVDNTQWWRSRARSLLISSRSVPQSAVTRCPWGNQNASQKPVHVDCIKTSTARRRRFYMLGIAGASHSGVRCLERALPDSSIMRRLSPPAKYPIHHTLEVTVRSSPKKGSATN